MRSPTLVLSLLLTATAIAAGATASTAADPGITKTILLGGTSPLSGPAADASVARGADAYFKYVNSRGGVNGRTIAYKYVDDAHDPVLTVQETRRLVEQDNVFAIFNSVGAEQNAATRDYLNAAKVPQLFVASGATTFGRDYRKYPWTIGFQPSYAAEGWIYGKYLARAKPGAKIAVLHQADARGADLLAGLRQGLARSKARVVAAQPAEATAPRLRAQVASLKASGADVLALFAAPSTATQGYAHAIRLGWRPLLVTNSTSRVEGAVSIAFLKDPTDVAWRNDPAMRLYRSIMSTYAKGASAKDINHVYGMAVAYETVRVLKAAGKNPTRIAVLAQTRKLNDASNPFLLPGISIRTSATERFPIEQALLQRWSKGSWKTFGGLWGYRAG